MAASPPPSVRAPLFEGAIDVVGDIHGEIGALEHLLDRLGYDGHARHREGRRLVFVGDLCDRGPDSPAVLARVLEWVDAGRAQCVLGNHELNLLRHVPKPANGWFFDHDHDHARGRFLDCRRVTPGDRAAIVDALGRLPLALDRADLRVVHACWHQPSIDAFERLPFRMPWAKAYEMFETMIEHSWAVNGGSAAMDLAFDRMEPLLDDPEPFFAHPAFSEEQRAQLALLAEGYESYQMGNPLRVLTSGVELRTPVPYFASHRWRVTERVRWWEGYDDIPAIIGHYWRRPPGDAERIEGKPSLVGDDHTWLGPAARVLCVDFSVGARNGSGKPGDRQTERGALAAWRSDTAELVFDR